VGRTLCLALFCVCVAGSARAQATGVLVPDGRVTPAKARVLSNLAQLIVDPALRAPVRSSAWAAALRATAGASEAAIQLNLSNFALGDSSAFSLAIVSPVTDNARSTEIANLDGLAGRTRGELTYTRNIASDTRQSYYVGASLATPRFTYRLAPDGGETDRRRALTSVKAGLLFKDADATGMLTIGGRFERTYVAPDGTTLCRTVAGNPSGVQTCEEQVIGEPLRRTLKVVDLELRGRLPRFGAVGARVERDFENDQTVLLIPLWLVPDTEKSFAGGVQASYRTQGSRRWAIAVFVGQFKL
jgi:hypothetical protein